MCDFMCPTLSKWLAHLRITAHEDFNVSCCFPGCKYEDFMTYSALKSHIYRIHREKDVNSGGEIEPTEEEEEIMEANELEECSLDWNHITSEETLIEADVARLLHKDLDHQKRDAALFIMRQREVNGLSQSVVDDIIGGSRSLFNSTLLRLHAGIRKRLAESGSDLDVADIFDELQDPFVGLETAYLQEKYINDKFDVLVSNAW